MSLASLRASTLRNKRFLGITGMAAVAATVVAGAVIYPGFTTADVALNDGSVWVTNRSVNMVGHLNVQSKVLDGGFTATTDNFDVLQRAATVFMGNETGTLLNQVDVADMALGQDNAMAGSKQVSLGNTVMALADPAAGKVWVVGAANATSFGDKTTKPSLAGVPNATAVVGLGGSTEAGTVFVLNPKAAELTTLTVGPDGQTLSSKVAKVDGLPDSGKLQLTAVGEQAAVLDPDTGTLFLPGNKKVAVDHGRDGRIQQPSASGNSVAVETSAGLVVQPLGGGAPQQAAITGTGVPIAPVQQDGCIHAAWSGVNQYLHFCAGAGAKTAPIPKAGGQSRMVFRQNRDVVVLNDTNGGDVWLVNQNMMLVNNWDDIQANQNKSNDPNKDSTDPNVVNTLPDRTKPNRPPVAVADTFGVRAGATTILPVLYNDSDPDGDVLTVRGVTDKLAMGELQVIYGGTGLQLAVPPGTKPGTESFSYTADDGRGGSAQATVTVRVVPDTENAAPVSLRATSMVVVQGQAISQNVLADMSDPDGDNVFLVGAKAGDDTAQVKFSPDGELTYIDNGQTTGPKTVTVTVSDNRAVTEKKITVTVKPRGGVPPVANADYVRVVAGRTALVAPLKNDQDPGGGQLRLASVDKPTLGKASPIADNGTFSYTSATPGTAYLSYQVTNGPQSSTGLIRIDVVAADNTLAPIAVKDTAMLPTGGSTLVDVLGNDSDPAGGLLVVRGVDVPENSGLSATVLDHRLVKITDMRSSGQPTTLKYTISNGHGTAVGSIAVVQIPAPSTLQPPVAKDDEVTVRVGDVVRIPVLANDTDPNGDVLKHPEITQGPDASAGKLWVDQDSLRFLAGPTAGTVSAIYKVSNSSGQSDSAPVTIHVVAADPARNLPPAPKNVQGRVLAGSTTRIQIPLDGIDPDGDSVQLAGLDTAPTLGTAVSGNGFISYTAAGNSAGTDSFTYRVRDRLGAEAVGTVQVGIAPVGAVNHPPQAQDDYITIRPGRRVALDVVLNDSDPDGDPLAVVRNGFTGPADMNPSVTEQGRVLVTAPSTAGTATLNYTLADPRGATAKANVRMTVSPDAPLRAPIARDDSVSVQEALGKNTVDVPVLKNDEDPDGVAEDLKVTLTRPTETASVLPGGSVRVNLLAVPQMIPYTVTDRDHLTATGIIWVPGTGQQYPVLKKSGPLKVKAGSSAVFNLGDYVKVRAGRTPRLTQADKVKLIGAPSEQSVTADGGIKYAANPDFYGPGSITFEVTDGTGPDDPQGLKSTLTVMTEVSPSPAKNQPPTATGTQLDVAQLESATLDLSRLASDPENDKLTFKLSGPQPATVAATLSGTVLTLNAARNAVPGSLQTVGFEASDGRNSPAKAVVTLRVVSSTKPLAVANEDVVPDAHAGRPEVVAVLANDTNPFPDTPLKLVDVKLITGANGTVVEKLSDKVKVTAPENFTGNVVVGYTVEDKTGDKNRRVDGRITLNVKGKPAVPAAPRVQEVKSKQVMLQWAAPADNGSPLTGYTVMKNDGGTQDCATNTCLVTGLTNAKPYTFTVKASNAVGSSDYSKPSASATPDASPDTPAPPAVKRGDGELALSWVAPTGQYSPVKTYNVEISPAPAGQNPQKTGIAGTTLSWTGLTNGTDYTFRVQAVNSAPEPSAWSQYSLAGKPAGKPFTPAAPVLTVLDTLGSQNQVRLDWTQPDLNGGVLKNYTLTKYLDGAPQGVVTTTQNTATASLPNGTGNYTFAVSASTEVDISDLSPQSTARRSVSRPGPVTGLSIAATNTAAAGRQIKVSFTPPSGGAMGGSTSGELSYQATVSSTGATSSIVPGQVMDAPNGTGTTVTIVVRSAATQETSGAVQSGSVAPYGTAGTPSINASNGAQGDNQMHYSWSAPGSNTDSVAVRIDEGGGFGGEITAKSGSGSVNLGGPNISRTIKIQSRNSKGDWGPVAEATASSGGRVPMIVNTDPGPGGHTCTVPASGGDFYWVKGPPATCHGVVNTAGQPGGNWLTLEDGNIEIDSCTVPWPGQIPWYHMKTGRLAGFYVHPPTVNIIQGSTAGLPGC
ncbi:Ig-like domain-containing protein [Arthrobacter sp. A2-55]|uniref:Ig-like domain-containing protein n=1 Tax=Arthrobacter sp. A2-55 TaxID=2897337 RepID=UPI0021CD347B|nr:Ig-like domain-containing protein [Arthrobacter sp. A2-55]MCU6480126.1 Ig-like domain-containing protein [Arthrobacter sp. A2-55]